MIYPSAIVAEEKKEREKDVAKKEERAKPERVGKQKQNKKTLRALAKSNYHTWWPLPRLRNAQTAAHNKQNKKNKREKGRIPLTSHHEAAEERGKKKMKGEDRESPREHIFRRDRWCTVHGSDDEPLVFVDSEEPFPSTALWHFDSPTSASATPYRFEGPIAKAKTIVAIWYIYWCITFNLGILQ